MSAYSLGMREWWQLDIVQTGYNQYRGPMEFMRYEYKYIVFCEQMFFK